MSVHDVYCVCGTAAMRLTLLISQYTTCSHLSTIGVKYMLCSTECVYSDHSHTHTSACTHSDTHTFWITDGTIDTIDYVNGIGVIDTIDYVNGIGNEITCANGHNTFSVLHS